MFCAMVHGIGLPPPPFFCNILRNNGHLGEKAKFDFFDVAEQLQCCTMQDIVALLYPPSREMDTPWDLEAHLVPPFHDVTSNHYTKRTIPGQPW